LNIGAWRKSSRSGDQDHCVEVAAGSLVGVRDTKDRAGGMIVLSATSWSVFLMEVKK
jgi:hypothetical protein